MEALMPSLAGLGSFALYFTVSLVLLVCFKAAYTAVTPHDEWQLIKESKSAAAAIAFIGAILGFALALASAAANSVSLLDFAIWGVVALIAQVGAFFIVRLRMPRIVERINDDEVSAGIVLGGVSVAVGLLNAACMTY